MWYIPLFQKPHLPCHFHWHLVCFWSGLSWFLLKKHNSHSQFLLSPRKSSFDFNNFKHSISSKLCFYVLCEIKQKPENTFKVLVAYLVMSGAQNFQFTTAKGNKLRKRRLMAYSLCVLLELAVKCCCENSFGSLYSAHHIIN